MDDLFEDIDDLLGEVSELETFLEEELPEKKRKITPEERRDRQISYQRSYRKKNPSKKIAELSPESRERLREQKRRSARKKYKNLSPESKKTLLESRKTKYRHLSPESKKTLLDSKKTKYRNLSPESKKTLNKSKKTKKLKDTLSQVTKE